MSEKIETYPFIRHDLRDIIKSEAGLDEEDANRITEKIMDKVIEFVNENYKSK